MELYGTIADLTATRAMQSFGILIILHDPLRVFLAGAMANNLPANARDTRDLGSILESGRLYGVGNGSPLQYSCLENSMDRGNWWVIVHRASKSQTPLSN